MALALVLILGVSDAMADVIWRVQSVPIPAEADGSVLYGVSCWSSRACTAVGYGVPRNAAVVPFADRWDGTSWSYQSVATPPNAVGLALRSVSCPTIAFCLAVGNTRAGSDETAPSFAEGWDGTGWSAEPTGTGGLMSVSCTSEAECSAVGEGG